VTVRPASRLFAAVAAVALAVTGLTACRSDPAVAAYVGDRKVTIAEVDKDFDQVRAKAPGSKVTRQDIADLLVAVEIGKLVLAENKLTQSAQQTPPEAVAQQVKMPADLEYVQKFAEWDTILATLRPTLKPAELSDKALLDVYNALAATGVIPAGRPIDEVRQQLGQAPVVQSAVSTSLALGEQVKKSHASINPRFLPLRVPLYVPNQDGSLLFFNVPYVDNTGPVTDLGAPPAA
jgi:hypothetical protein